jgi:two-component system cell cycle sensor histidine kinase/response regulator CckA
VSHHDIDDGGAESLRRLAAGTVHDVNNLLVVVIGCAELALDDAPLSPRARQLMQEIVGVGERASSLTRQFLKAGRAAAAPAAVVDVAAVLTAAESLLARLVGDHITLHLEPGAAPRFVQAAASQIDQVLLNLALNARDAMPTGGTLSITLGGPHDASSVASARAEPRRLIRLTVADTGRGIDPAIRDRMFEPFVTTKADSDGRGLGLAVVRAIVDQLGGTIRMTSVPSQGTTFVIDLPAAEPAA